MNINIKQSAVIAFLQQFINDTDLINDGDLYTDSVTTNLNIDKVTHVRIVDGHINFYCDLDSKWNGVDHINMVVDHNKICKFVHDYAHNKQVMVAAFREETEETEIGTLRQTGENYLTLFPSRGLHVLPIVEITDVFFGCSGIIFEATEEPIDDSKEERGSRGSDERKQITI
jgi:hypothetical protein